MAEKSNTTKFMEHARNKHGNKYDYSWSEYIIYKTKRIRCYSNPFNTSVISL